MEPGKHEKLQPRASERPRVSCCEELGRAKGVIIRDVDTGDSPRADTDDPVISDARESLKDSLTEPWTKQWLDVRTFFAQRRALQRDPTLALDRDAPLTIKGWRTPLKYAVQGLILPVVLVQVIATLSSVFVVRPASYIDRLIKEIDEVADAINSGTRIVAATPAGTKFAPVSDLKTRPTLVGADQPDAFSRNKYLRLFKVAQERIKYARHQLLFAQNTEAAGRMAGAFAPALSFVLAAFAFRVFAGKLLARSTSGNARHAHEVFLYTYSSSLFWANVVMLVTGAVGQTALTYSGVFDDTMYDAAHEGPMSALSAAGTFAAIQIGSVVLLASPWLVVGWRRFVKDTRKAYRLPSVPVWLDPLLGAVFAANLVTFIVLVVLLNGGAWVYGQVSTVVQEHRVSLERSATSP